MGKQLSIYLDKQETKRLAEISLRECRRPVDQVRYLLRQALGISETSESPLSESMTNSEMHNDDALDSDPQRVAIVA